MDGSKVVLLPRGSSSGQVHVASQDMQAAGEAALRAGGQSHHQESHATSLGCKMCLLRSHVNLLRVVSPKVANLDAVCC